MITTLRDGARLDVVLNNPLRLNAMTEETWQELAQIGRDISEEIRIVVLRAEGRAFSAGLDRKVFVGQAKPDLASLVAGTDAQIESAIKTFQDAFTCWRTTHAITIAAVQGDAIGAGFQLALACDFRIVADNARFSLKETSLGLVPDLAGTKPLVNLLGYSRALEIALAGEPVDAQRALMIGLVNSVVPVAELETFVDAFVAKLVALPDASMRATKRLILGALERDFAHQEDAERRAQSQLLRNLSGL
ncbi:MAG TPA: enoyl-CoA hydratase/isomerase family protein [Candidatus Nanopelagicaceae bacterium]|nr:enoyl-CoA hydratase/isomerase family protein [Candidatus Nanopelagicaceae bacterium]